MNWLLADDDASPSDLAERVVRRLEQLAAHLAPLLGELGVRALFARSAGLTRATYPWLAGVFSELNAPWPALRGALEQREAREIRDAFSTLLATFVALLGRLIGDGLAAALLREVWPEEFPLAVKETT